MRDRSSFIQGGILLLVVVAAIAFPVLNHKPAALEVPSQIRSGDESTSKSTHEGRLHELTLATIRNYPDSGFFRVEAVLAVERDKANEAAAILVQVEEDVQIWMNKLLADKNLSELRVAENLLKLRRQLLSKINDEFESNGGERFGKDVRFTEFLIQ